MNNEIDEQWLEVHKIRNTRRNLSLVSISNTGKYRRADGTIGCLELRSRTSHNSNSEYCYKIIAEHFLITVKRPDQKFIDHITHNPTEYNVNDVRNLRWCTQKENLNFDEAKKNRLKGMPVGSGGEYQRAKKLYKSGELSEDEFQPYRNAWNEYIRARRRKIASRHVESQLD